MENRIKVSKTFNFVLNIMQASITIFIKIKVIKSGKGNVLNHHHFLLKVDNLKAIILRVAIKFITIIIEIEDDEFILTYFINFFL